MPAEPTAGPPALLRNLDDAARVAEAAFRSNLFPGLTSGAAALMKIMLGAEMGFGPAASLADVHVIEGRPSVGAHLRAAAIKRSEKYDYSIVWRHPDGRLAETDEPGAAEQNTDRVVELAFWEHTGHKQGAHRKGKSGWSLMGRLRYAIEDAQAKGWHLTQIGKPKPPWVKTPRNMLFARALTDGYKTYCPDLTAGVLAYDPDELDGDRPEPQRAEIVAPSRHAALTDGEIEQGLAEHGPAAPTTKQVAGLVEQAARAAPYRAPVEATQTTTLAITSEQMQEIDALVLELGISSRAFVTRLQQLHDVRDPAALTSAQADSVLQGLRKKQAEKKARAAAPAPDKSVA